MLQHLIHCMRELKQSRRLKAVMEAMLGVGNYCNGGSGRGGAAGFRIQLLEKAIEMSALFVSLTRAYFNPKFNPMPKF